MPSQDKPAGNSPFEIVTSGKSKKIGKTGIIVGIAIAVFLILSVVAGVLLVKQQQNVSEKAAFPACPGGEQCPVAGDPGRLRSCTPPQSDNSPDEMLCALAGRVGVCGGVQYCCPSAGGAWTTNMSSCAAATTPTPSPSPTPTSTSTASPTPASISALTSSPTPTAPATGSQNACNGTCGSNSNCQSGLYCYSGYCRNPLCASDSACGCTSGTVTPTATATSVGTTTQTTPLPIPVTGTDWATYLGVGVGVTAILVSILLAI